MENPRRVIVHKTALIRLNRLKIATRGSIINFPGAYLNRYGYYGIMKREGIHPTLGDEIDYTRVYIDGFLLRIAPIDGFTEFKINEDDTKIKYNYGK